VTPIESLLEIMARLRDPAGGCPWDLEQTFASVAPHTLEEAYEVVDAIERGDLPALEEELGDLLLQVVFHAQIARDLGAFDFERVARGIAAKLVRRHPHVFGEERLADAAAQSLRWEEIKAAEKAAAGRAGSVLDDVPLALPALTRAVKLGRRAARIGFDWPDATGARAKVDEELAELDAALAGGAPEAVAHEFGDVLLALANLARHLGVDAEGALRSANRRFATRFRHVESRVAGGAGGTTAELEAYWQEAKAAERRED
jgi:tetrapyrrole methylase family protein/MazG family protein/ATP diphosphatase